MITLLHFTVITLFTVLYMGAARIKYLKANLLKSFPKLLLYYLDLQTSPVMSFL